MAPIAARGCLDVVENLAHIVAIEVLTACQGLEFRRDGAQYDEFGEIQTGIPVRLAPGVAELLERVRRVVPRWTEDRVLHRDIEAVSVMLRSNGLMGREEAW